jgi:type IV pilus assembly protein PilO
MALGLNALTKLKWYYNALIVVVVCSGLLAGFWYQFLKPIQVEIAGKTAQVEELRRTIATIVQKGKELEQIKKEAIVLQAKLDMLKAILPLDKETDQIFRTVELQARLSGLKVNRVAPRATVDHDVYVEYPIELDVLGTYHNVGAFLDKIRQLPRIVNINALRLQSRAAEGDLVFTSSVGATYTATTFVYKEEAIAPAAPPAKPVK